MAAPTSCEMREDAAFGSGDADEQISAQRGFVPPRSEKRRRHNANWFVLHTQNIADIGAD